MSDALGEMAEALRMAKSILDRTPDFTTNCHGRCPAVTTSLARKWVDQALNRYDALRENGDG